MGGPFDFATDDCAVRLGAGAKNAGRSLSASAWMSTLSKAHQKNTICPMCLLRGPGLCRPAHCLVGHFEELQPDEAAAAVDDMDNAGTPWC